MTLSRLALSAGSSRARADHLCTVAFPKQAGPATCKVPAGNGGPTHGGEDSDVWAGYSLGPSMLMLFCIKSSLRERGNGAQQTGTHLLVLAALLAAAAHE